MSAITLKPLPVGVFHCNVLFGSVCRPHIPISKLVVSESYDTYVSRSFQVTREILAECKNQGKASRWAALCFRFLLWDGPCAENVKFPFKATPSDHKRYGKLAVSMECDSLFLASFTQETRS